MGRLMGALARGRRARAGAAARACRRAARDHHGPARARVGAARARTSRRRSSAPRGRSRCATTRRPRGIELDAGDARGDRRRSCVRFCVDVAPQAPVAGQGHRALPRHARRARGGACPRAGPRDRPGGRRRRLARRGARHAPLGTAAAPSCPAYDQAFDPEATVAVDPGTGTLREAEDIELERDSARLWLWRARTTELQAAGSARAARRATRRSTS